MDWPLIRQLLLLAVVVCGGLGIAAWLMHNVRSPSAPLPCVVAIEARGGVTVITIRPPCDVRYTAEALFLVPDSMELEVVPMDTVATGRAL